MDTSTSHPRRWPWVLAWLVLTVYFVTPPREVYDQTLDRSNYATYAHFVTHGFQWGADVIPMAGPLGFVLFGYCYSGELYLTRLIGDLLLCAAFGAMLLHLVHRARSGTLRWIWLGVMVLVVPFIDDLLLDTAVFLAAICLLLAPPGKPNRWAYLGAVVLAFISLIKGTHLMMCAAVFGTIALLGILERRPARVLRPAAVFLVSFLLFWILARQNPLNLPAFLFSTWQLASGYGLSMGLEEHPFFFQMGVMLATGVAVVFAWTAFFGVRTLQAAAVLLFICFFAFLKWKHGYVRADGHVYIFFASAAIVAITAWLIGFSPLLTATDASYEKRIQPRWRSLVGLGLVTLVTTFAVIGSTEFWLGRFALVARTIPERFISHARYLIQPGQLRAKLDRELAAVRLAADLPQVRNQIGTGTVDFFGNEEGIILLNDLTYRPRPMGGGTFNVVTSWLQQRNEAFVSSPQTAPDWQILKLAEFDNRLPSADDGLALRAILDCYRPVLMQREYLLLKRDRNRVATSAPQLISTVPARPGVSIDVPDPGDGRVLLFSLHAPFDTYGRVRSFLYRPPILEGRFITEKYPWGRRFELKPTILQNPVILSPMVENTSDFVNLYGARTVNQVRSVVLTAASGFSTDQFTVSFFSAPRPTPSRQDEIDELLTYDQFTLYNRTPVEIITQETGITELSNEPITLVHAPGSMTWTLEPNDQQVIFSYGLIPKAYLNGGNSDGVEFNLEVLWPPNDGRVMFKHLIRPQTVSEDRGMHRARVILPPYEPGAQLRIRTHPGPDNDGANDQSYITRVNIKPGDLIADQFSGLGVIPSNRHLPHGSVASVNNQPVFLLHAPDELLLDVPVGATTFNAHIGLLPGAYTDGGNSDGVIFRIFTAGDNGLKTQVWTRTLDPVRQESDRGMVAVAIPIDATIGAKQLIVTTEIGPNGDRSWDQSYISQVRFE